MSSETRAQETQSRVREFVSDMAREGGFEKYWASIHGESLNRTEKESVLKFSPPPHEQAIALDAGCGEGRNAFGLAALYRTVYAVDFSEESCRRLEIFARERGIHNIEASAQTLLEPITVPPVDAAIMIGVLQHFDNVPDRQRVLKNLWNCLKPGGRLTLLAFNHDRLLNRLRLQKQDLYKSEGYPYFHYFRIGELRELMAGGGFENIQIRGCVNLPASLHESLPTDAVRKLDVKLSSLRISRYLGIHLLVTAQRPR